ncbi:Meiotic recombination rec8-like protein [Cladobotryum mycophilum]|uniref:Meiotic recombination rec8-like protein n=1 Tax=Cladobotryum mycophilum TaxID=491253 RepID=A0ABR0SG16_9HYPO
MFYSHEILSNSQYGVATIWYAFSLLPAAHPSSTPTNQRHRARLIATVGKDNQRRLTKKAIQNVNVPKACEKILDPGAPLALRLQGNLLYGVSRVFSQQCGYVLNDAEKAQSDMMTFFRIMRTSEIDPQAGKTKRQNIILQDDPSFDLLSVLPNVDLLNWDKELVFFPSQGSASKFSQMTPLGGSQQSSLSGHNFALINLELPSSSHSAASFRIPSHFGHSSPQFPKTVGNLEDMPEFQPFADDELVFGTEVKMNFDGLGNLIETGDQEPELPPLPGQEELRVEQEVEIASTMQMQAKANEAHNLLLLGDDANLLEFGEAALPDAVAFPTRKTVQKPATSQNRISETTDTEQVSAKMTRTRRNKAQTMLDTELDISRGEFRSWTENYVDNMGALRHRSTGTTKAQARKNALALLYGNGIADIGAYQVAAGFAHPLATDFSGTPLKLRLKGQEPDEFEPEFEAKKKKGRRRKSDEAFDGQEEIDRDRHNTRRRVDEEAERGRGDDHMGDAQLVFGDDLVPEIGMDAAPPMEDRHSSSVMPQSRAGSVVPGSSVRGSAQKLKTAPSPLLGKGNVLGSIHRYSDPADEASVLGHFRSQDSSFVLGGPVSFLDLPAENDTQPSVEALDVASQNFLSYAIEEASKKGTTRNLGQKSRRWIEFEELAHPTTHSKGSAAQSFLHVLSLASKSTISVEQDGADRMKPFGAIRIGIDVPEVEEQPESEDELA